MQAHLSIATRLVDRAAQVRACANLATTYEALKDYEEAKAYQEQNLSIATLVNDRVAKIKALGNLGKENCTQKIHTWTWKNERKTSFFLSQKLCPTPPPRKVI